MKTPQQIVFVRHAESLRNKLSAKAPYYFTDAAVRDSVCGIPDHLTPITQEGKEHARRTGALIKERFGVFDAVIHSGYLRTIKTAEAILEAYSRTERERMPIIEDLHIREREAGYAFSMTKSEIDLHFPWMDRYWKECGSYFSRPIGGESLADVVEGRVRPFLRNLNKTYAGNRLLVVLHGRTLAAVRFVLEKWSIKTMEEFLNGRSPRNCGYTLYERDEEKGLVPKEYNVVCA